MNASAVRRLTQKLKTKGDISRVAADNIYSLYSSNKLNPDSPKADLELISALEEWFYAVEERLNTGARGNFIFTLDTAHFYHGNLSVAAGKALQALKERGVFGDFFGTLMVDNKVYSSFPESFKELFTWDTLERDGADFYTLKQSRAGFYYYKIKELKNARFHTIAKLTEKFFPIAKCVYGMEREFFEIASGARQITARPWVLGGRQMDLYVLAAFTKKKDIPCMTVSDTRGKAIAFVAKEYEPMIKKVKDTPFEDLVKNALNENIINQKMAWALLNDNAIRGFPVVEFVEASVNYLESLVHIKVEWEAIKKEIKRDSKWLVETR